MPYTIGYSQHRNRGPVSEARRDTAKAALDLVRSLQMSDETIRYIKAPWGWEICTGELEMAAAEEDK